MAWQQQRHASGRLIDMESAPQSTLTPSPENGVLSHTNHFSNPDRLGVKQVLDEERRSTLHRYRRINQLLTPIRDRNGKLSMTKAEAMLQDHNGRPESVCRHANSAFPEDERYQTVVSVVMDLYTGQLKATMGSPCENSYQILHL